MKQEFASLERFILTQLEGFEILNWAMDDKTGTSPLNDYDSGMIIVKVDCVLERGGTAGIELKFQQSLIRNELEKVLDVL